MKYAKRLFLSLRMLEWYEWTMCLLMTTIAGITLYECIIGENLNPVWLATLNFISGISGIFCIFLTAEASVSNFVFAIVNTLTYSIYLFYWHVWGTFALELFFYLPVDIISWYGWDKHRNKDKDYIADVKKLNHNECVLLGFVIFVFSFAAYMILYSLGGMVPVPDAMIFSFGIFAILLKMMRYREQYVLWVLTDMAGVYMYFKHFDMLYLTKKAIYLIVAVMGFANWYKMSSVKETS